MQNSKLHVTLLKSEIFYFSLSRFQDSTSQFLYQASKNASESWEGPVSIRIYFGARIHQVLKVNRLKLGCL